MEQLQALAFMFLKLHTQAFSISLPFFGFYCLRNGTASFGNSPRLGGRTLAFQSRARDPDSAVYLRLPLRLLPGGPNQYPAGTCTC